MHARIQVFAGPAPVVRHKRAIYDAKDSADMIRFVEKTLISLSAENPDVIAFHIERPR